MSAAFGPRVLLPSGEINRPVLRSLVFEDEAKADVANPYALAASATKAQFFAVFGSMKLAQKIVIGMLRLVEGDVTVNELTIGLVISTVTVFGEPYTAETLPSASLAHGYSV